MDKRTKTLKCRACQRPIKNFEGTLKFPTKQQLEEMKKGIMPKQICHDCYTSFSGTSLLEVVKEIELIGQRLEKIDGDIVKWRLNKKRLKDLFILEDENE